MKMNSIGVFDSGLGGLSVWQELVRLMPNENIIYYADSANCPYGEKSQAEIIAFSSRIVDFLLSKSCKMVVVACNTATAMAIHHLREHYSISFIGMEPAVKPAAMQSRTERIGVIATKNTLKGEHFKKTSERYAKNVQMFVQIGYGLVELVEAGKANSPECEKLLREYLEPMINNHVDQIVLGCTHYPFLIPMIQKITQNQVNVINPAIAVARHTQNTLRQNEWLNPQNQATAYEFYTSGEPDFLKEFVLKILNEHETLMISPEKMLFEQQTFAELSAVACVFTSDKNCGHL
jgi:glutamate racemase